MYCFNIQVIIKMRRAVIFILLGIISTSTFSTLLASFFSVDPTKILLHTVAGAVVAGNYSYWHLGHMGPLLIELTSITGDADIYIADHMRPSHDLDGNNFSSNTCGLDVISIPDEFPRPIGVGVFGYWSHTYSEYRIAIYLDISPQAKKFDEKVFEPKPAPSKDVEQEDRPRFYKIRNFINIMIEKFIF